MTFDFFLLFLLFFHHTHSDRSTVSLQIDLSLYTHTERERAHTAAEREGGKEGGREGAHRTEGGEGGGRGQPIEQYDRLSMQTENHHCFTSPQNHRRGDGEGGERK